MKRFKGVAHIGTDRSWQPLLADFAELGQSLGAGRLAFAWVRRTASSMVVLLPDESHTVLSLGAKCPRERLFQALLRTG